MAFLCRNFRNINITASPSKISMENILSYNTLSGLHVLLGGSSFYSSKAGFPSVESLKQNSDSLKPWLMRPFKRGSHKFYDVGKSNGESGFSVSNIPKGCIASTKGWLAFMDDNNLHNKGEVSYFLRSPFQLPNKKEDVQLPSLINLHYLDNGFLSLPKTLLSRNMVRNVVLSSSDPYDPNCIVMANVQDGALRRLAYCRPGRTEEDEWTILHDSYPMCDQLVYSNELSTFYSPSRRTRTGFEAWDFSKGGDPKRGEFVFKDILSPNHQGQEKILRNKCTRKAYIVVDDSTGNLFMVFKWYASHVSEDGTILLEDPNDVSPYKTQRIDVFKCNSETKVMDYVPSLDDRVIFLGFNQSFILSANDFSGLKPNSIYFLDDFPERIYGLKCQYGGHDSGIYDLSDKSITHFSPLAESEKIDQQMFWIAPTTFSDVQ